MNFKSHTFTRTATTTGDRGAHVYEIDGTHGKRATVRPFLTTIAACREYVNNAIFWASTEGRAEVERQRAEEIDHETRVYGDLLSEAQIANLVDEARGARLAQPKA